jgi:cyclase
MVRIAIAAATTLLLAGAATAQQPPAAPPPPDFSKVEIKTTDLGDNVYMLEGDGGNITVAVAKDGIIMVDSEFAPLHDKIKAAIAAVSNQPIKYLVDTHFHGDHTGGNELFAKDGAAVVDEASVKKRLAAGTTNGLTGIKTPPAPEGALPSKTTPAPSRSGSTAASPISRISPMRIPTATPMSGSKPPMCCRPAILSPMAAIPTSISPTAATSRA